MWSFAERSASKTNESIGLRQPCKSEDIIYLAKRRCVDVGGDVWLHLLLRTEAPSMEAARSGEAMWTVSGGPNLTLMRLTFAN